MEGLLAERYQLETVVGSGGMGTVWRAHDLLLDRQVAIKEVRYSAQLTDEERQEQTTRAVAEARHAARLEHPRIVPIYDVLIHDGRPWIVMRFISGQSLEQMVLAHGRLAPAEVQRLGRGLLEALAAAHRGGVLHRDVKPSNVLIADDGEPMLTDFSIARAIGQGTATNTGLIVGSPGYIAPERIVTGVAGPEADLFGLGATLFFAVEGVAPFAHEDAMAGAFAAAIHPHPRPKHAGPTLTPLLDGLLEKDPRARMTITQAAELLGLPARSIAPSPEVAPISAPLPPVEPVKPVEPETLEESGAFVAGRAEIPAPKPTATEEATEPSGLTRWAEGRLALIAAALVVLVGGAAAIAAVTNRSPKDGAPPPSPASSQPNVTPSATPTEAASTSEPSQTAKPTAPKTTAATSSPFFTPELKTFGAGWQPGMSCQSNHASPARAIDASSCGLSPAPIPDLTKTSSRWVTISLEQFAPGQADGYMGCGAPTYPISGMATAKVDQSGTSGNRAGFYCETTGDLTNGGNVIGACTYIMWTSGNNSMLGTLYNCFKFSDEGASFRPTPAMLSYLRNLWNARA